MADKQLIVVSVVAVAAVGAACWGVYASTSTHEPRPAYTPVGTPGGGGARPGPQAAQRRAAVKPLSAEEQTQLVAAVEARAESLAFTVPEITSLGVAASRAFGPSLRAALERMLGASVNIGGADAPGGMLGSMRIDVDRITIAPLSKDDDGSIGAMLNRNAATSASGRPIPGTTSVEAAEARRKAAESGEGQPRTRQVTSFRTVDANDAKGPVVRVTAPLLTGDDEPARQEGEPAPSIAIDLAWNAEKGEWVQAGTTITGGAGMLRPGGMPVRVRMGGTAEERVTN